MKKLLLIPLGALCIGLLPAAASASTSGNAQQKDVYLHEVDPSAFYVRFGSPYYYGNYYGYHPYYYGYHHYYYPRYYYRHHYWYGY